MPTGKGALFIPVKAVIRKKIKKEAGDTVHIVLHRDHLSTQFPEEMKLSMEFDLEVLKRLETCTDGEKKAFV